MSAKACQSSIHFHRLTKLTEISDRGDIDNAPGGISRTHPHRYLQLLSGPAPRTVATDNIPRANGLNITAMPIGP